ncbi:amidinotransferase [Flavobacteriaceae bacterium AU392]|nr:amidinotransferase [Flavobacteriaceae bacterium]RKM86036.1 amidinotransferase [Flavobacteriaceae bacterium AU392]
MQQITDTILMIRPNNIRANEQTVSSNYYQKKVIVNDALQVRAKFEFDTYVNKLKDAGVNVIVYESDDDLDTPDAHFPNNWISLHSNGNVALYPMYAKNRRLERREDVLDFIEQNGFIIENVIDYSSAEDESVFLEGTGSIVLDRDNHKAYCAISPRSDESLFIEFCEDFEYTPIVFIANQTVNEERKAIYHTNVMMCIAETFAIICLECIDDKKERKNVIKHLKTSGKQIIEISEDQVAQFAGNMLQVKGSNNKRYLVMSQSACNSLTNNQINAIKSNCDIISSEISTIEACGGGSIRCLMIEVLLQKLEN